MARRCGKPRPSASVRVPLPQSYQTMNARFGALLDTARSLLPRAHVPYSGQAEAAVALTSDGSLVPGVRVESASFSLVIPATQNAVTTAVALGYPQLAALALTGRPATAATGAYVRGLPGTWERVDGAVWINRDVETPEIGAVADPFLGGLSPDPVSLVRQVAGRAWVPESAFPVGCVLVLPDGRGLPGVNVEHPDWTSILCAERNALSTAVTWGCPPAVDVILSCLRDPDGSPCGACRQLLVERAPDARVIMDRGDRAPEAADVRTLLPGAFDGRGLAVR